ncbi:hypothetical protein MHBO_002484 [Bonamia ostreae]|uniref:Uncharacterized protein n=1 Tax=Bonamia ostreae TaxID=126728 RepID=A0ABV2AMJ3_9EUKA
MKHLLIIVFVIEASFVQYEEPYDAHPWTYGSEIEAQDAETVCNNMNKRICNKDDLEAFYQQNRSICKKAWAYNRETKDIFGHVVSVNSSCFENDFINGVFPQRIFTQRTYDRFWCLIPKEDFENTFGFILLLRV